MKKLTVTIPQARANYQYTVIIGDNILRKLGSFFQIKKYSSALIVCDANTAQKYAAKLLSCLPLHAKICEIKSGEKYKNLKTAQKIWQMLLNFGADRKSLVLNVGGGQLCDIGGFAASTYMRGIDFVHIPTTLLAQVDASIGGKTGVNFRGIKNSIGVFQQPRAVIIDLASLASLPARHFTSAFGEIIKQAAVADKNFYKLVTSKKPASFSKGELINIIYKSCKIKASVVQNDAKESGKRKILNFGHTVGHALESVSLLTKNPLLHGEAVSVGMIAENKIAQSMGLLGPEEASIFEQDLKYAGLPIRYAFKDSAKIMQKIASDKKAEGGAINWTLMDRIGHCLYDRKVPEIVVKEALTYIYEKP